MRGDAAGGHTNPSHSVSSRTVHAADDLVPFFVSGLVHRLGNQLLMLQGTALRLAELTPTDGCEAVLKAARRGTATLRVLRLLSGDDTGDASGRAGELLDELLELARIPVRERGLALLPRGEPSAVPLDVVPGAFVRLVARVLRGVVEALPAGARGTVAVGLARDAGGRGVVEVAFAPAAGCLPFPLAVDALVALASDDRGAATGAGIAPAPNGVVVTFPQVGASVNEA